MSDTGVPVYLDPWAAWPPWVKISRGIFFNPALIIFMPGGEDNMAWASWPPPIFDFFNSSHAVRDLGHETVPTVAAVRGFCRFRGVPKVQPAEDTQTMTHARSTISLVVRVISRSKNNFYDVIRLKIIESQYFLKETVKVGLEKIKQNGGQLKATKCRWISSMKISNLDVDRDFSR